jgi:hypothetical protein
MAGCFESKLIVLHLDLYEIELLPENLFNNMYEYKHEMLYSKVMKRLKTYRINAVFLVSLKFLEYEYYEFGGVRTRSIDINNIDATPYEILCLMNNVYNSKWVGEFGMAV